MKRKIKKIILPLLLTLGFSAGFYLIIRSDLFSVSKIVVTTDYDINANPKVTAILRDIKGKNILLVNDKNLIGQIKAMDIKIKEVEIKREIPNKITVQIESRQALAAIPVNGKYYLMDREGLFFSEQLGASGMAIINLGLQNIHLGSRIDERRKFILLIIDSLKGEERVADLYEREEDLEVHLSNGTTVFFSAEKTEGETQTALNALQTIISRFRIEGKRPNKIDLRFEKPVVSF